MKIDKQNKKILEVMTYLVINNVAFESLGLDILITNCDRDILQHLVKEYYVKISHSLIIITVN